MTTWGVVATVKAPRGEILDFAAHHLELGAQRVYLYLDAPDPGTLAALKTHPKVRVVACDDAYWQRQGRRPVKHQVRQGRNATHAYRRRAEVDWLAHVDVDEFLWPETRVADALAALPSGVLSARVHPMEALAGDGTAFKALIPKADRAEVTARLYPTYGAHLRAGFLSHVAGKLFVRTGLEGVELRIHNMFVGEAQNPHSVDLGQVALCHLHARPFGQWLDSYRYRLSRGSYRAELPPARPRAEGGLTLHELFGALEAAGGEAALRGFFDEVCADSPSLRDRLAREGLLRHIDLELSASRRRQFPEFD